MVKLIDGGFSVDDRGRVSFVNDFTFKGVKRFYIVENHQKGYVRAWHGHKKEAKYAFVTKGTVWIRVVKLNGYEEDIESFFLSADKPQVLYIPKGYANGFKTLTDDAQIMFFSTCTLEEGDDIRIGARTSQWGGMLGWDIEPR